MFHDRAGAYGLWHLFRRLEVDYRDPGLFQFAVQSWHVRILNFRPARKLVRERLLHFREGRDRL